MLANRVACLLAYQPSLDDDEDSADHGGAKSCSNPPKPKTLTHADAHDDAVAATQYYSRGGESTRKRGDEESKQQGEHPGGDHYRWGP